MIFSHKLLTLTVAFSLMAGCHFGGQHQSGCDEIGHRCDVVGGMPASEGYPSYPGTGHSVPPKYSPPVDPQQKPSSQTPKQVPPSDGFLPPVKGPANK